MIAGLFGGGGSDEDAAMVAKHAEMREKTLEELDKKIDERFAKIPDPEHIDDIRTREFLRSIGAYEPD